MDVIKQSRAGTITFILVFLGFLLALYASYEYVHLQFFPYSGGASCSISEGLDCEEAIRSSYSSILGRSLGNWAAFFYSWVLGFLLLYIPLKKEERDEDYISPLSTLFSLSFISLLFSLWLFKISITEFSALCPVCIGLYLVSILLVFSLYFVEQGESLTSRITEGFRGIFFLFRKVPRFLIGDVFSRLFSPSFPIAFLAVLLGAIGVFSDQIFYHYFEYTDDPKANVSNIGKEWMETPVDEIASTPASGAFGDYRFGPEDAEIQIVEFFDMECPYCRMFYFELKDLQAKYPDKVSIEYRNYPLDKRCNKYMQRRLHVNACEAAYFTRCAGEQQKFHEALEYIMTLEAIENEPNSNKVRKAIRDGASTLGLDEEALDECMSSGRQKDIVKQDVEVAQQLGLSGTPSIWVNGRKVEELDNLEAIVDYLATK